MPFINIEDMKKPNPQHFMALIRQLRSYASELGQVNLQVTAVCNVSPNARDRAASAGVFIATALHSLATAEADTREAAIRTVTAQPSHEAVNLAKSYLAAADTVITKARLLLAEAHFNVTRAATGRDDLTIPALPDASAA